jgi:putative ABC transport system permease protein
MASAWQIKIVRDLWLHKGRTALVVLAIAAGLVGSGAVLVKYALVRLAITQGYLDSNPPSATLVTDQLTAEVIERIQELPPIREVEARRTLAGSIWIDGERHALRLFVADDLAATRIGRIEQTSGSWPPADGELAIERSSLPLAEVVPGDEVSLKTSGGQRRTLPVVGIAHDVGVAPGWMEQIVYAYANTATLESIGESPYLDELRLTVVDRTLDQTGLRRVAAEVAEELERLGLRTHEVSVPIPGEHIHAGQMNSLLFVQAALGLLALALSGLLVVNLMAAVLAGQVREIGMMKAVGASTAQIAGLYLTMVALMGLAASLIALPVAAVIGREYAEFTSSMLNFELADAQTPLWAPALQLAVGLMLPLLAASQPIYRGARMTVADALRDFGIDAHISRGFVLGRLLGNRPFLPRPLLLSIRNTLRRRGRLALTLLTLAAGGALYIGSLNLRASILHTVDTWFDAIRYDVSVQLAQPRSAAELERIVGRVPGVMAVEAWGQALAALELSDGTRSDAFRILAPPSTSELAEFPIVRGRWLAEATQAPDKASSDIANELVVNKKWLASVYGADVGDMVTLWVTGDATPWRIVGVVDSSPRSALAYASFQGLARAVGTPSGAVAEATMALIKLDPRDPGLLGHIEMVRKSNAGRAPSMIEQYHDRDLHGGVATGDPRAGLADAPRLFEVVLEGAGVPVASSLAVQTARKGQEDHMLLVVNLLWVMSFLAIAVGGFGLATTMSLAVLERGREIGVLRSIGASHRSILTIVITEALAIAVASWMIAVPLSVPMSYLLGAAFGRIMFETPMLFSAAPSAALLWLLVAMSLAVLASLWPALRATRITTREALASS